VKEGHIESTGEIKTAILGNEHVLSNCTDVIIRKFMLRKISLNVT
jgi:hypothetical protein